LLLLIALALAAPSIAAADDATDESATGSSDGCLGLEVTIDGAALEPGDDGVTVIVGTAGPDVILGTPGPDRIVGRSGDDAICSLAGDDEIIGGPGDDLVLAGPGEDVVGGGPGADQLSGEEGDDLLSGAGGPDELRGGSGSDTLDGGGGGALLIGDAGADTVVGDSGNDEVWAGDGNDIVMGGPGDDVLDGGTGSDRLEGGFGDDVLRGRNGDDVIVAIGGDDVLDGGPGSDLLSAGKGDDVVDAGPGADVVSGGAGDDTIDAGPGDDLVEAGRGADVVQGGDHADTLYGNEDDDEIRGGNGDDLIYGGGGADALGGGPGSDRLEGYNGRDVLHGGSGRDVLLGQQDGDLLFRSESPNADHMDGGTGENLVGMGKRGTDATGIRTYLTEDEALGFIGFSQLSSFATYHNCCENRVINIQLMADTVSGHVVMPGEVFSVNDTVGERTAEKGYVPAGAIIGGWVQCCDLPANMGGGTSQFGTTIYNAIFFAGLEDVEHTPHSLYFTRYPAGREATMGYPDLDVAFRNDTDAPVLVTTHHSGYGGTSIRVAFWGDNGGRVVAARHSCDPPGSSIFPEVEAPTTACSTFTTDRQVYKPNPAMDPSEEIRTPGQAGFSITVWRDITFADGAKVAEEDDWTYSAAPTVITTHPCNIPPGDPHHTGETCPGTTPPAPPPPPPQ
jgi:Ca2+-binding RTX toxin-like protein